MELIKAEKKDAMTIGEVHSKAWKQTYQDVFPSEFLYEDTPEKRSNDFLNTYERKDIHYFMVLENHKVIGVIKEVDNLDCLELAAIYFLADYRGKGYGKQTLQMVKMHADDRQICLWVLEINTKARNFYEKNGFVKTGKSRIIKRGNEYKQLQYASQS